MVNDMTKAMINRVKNCLDLKKAENVISDYSITVLSTETVEEFFVIQKLETTRQTDTSEIHVTVYKKEEDTLGSSSFIVSHEISKNEINNLIDKAVYSASFVHNKAYELVQGDKKMKKVRKLENVNPFDTLQSYAQKFINASIDENDMSIKFNSLELFFTFKNIHLITSTGIDYEKKIYNVMIESIPSFTDKLSGFKTELYRAFHYNNINDETLKQVENDAKDAVLDCQLRAKATKCEIKKKMDVILKDNNLPQLFFEVADNLNYANVYNKSNLFSIGNKVQTKPATKMNITLCKTSKEDFFDGEGILLQDTELIKNGEVVNYFGSKRFASYLGIEPTGMLNLLKMKKGTKSVEEFKQNEHIEILDMSGLQVDLYQGYIGGEVRLATYFDGKDYHPISGFSFSGDLKEVLNNYELSTETITLRNYIGPKYIKIKNVEIN